jgi:hypothetical protein
LFIFLFSALVVPSFPFTWSSVVDVSSFADVSPVEEVFVSSSCNGVVAASISTPSGAEVAMDE